MEQYPVLLLRPARAKPARYEGIKRRSAVGEATIFVATREINHQDKRILAYRPWKQVKLWQLGVQGRGKKMHQAEVLKDRNFAGVYLQLRKRRESGSWPLDCRKKGRRDKRSAGRQKGRCDASESICAKKFEEIRLNIGESTLSTIT